MSESDFTVPVALGTGEPVRKVRLALAPNFAARASGDGKIAHRGWRAEIILEMPTSSLGKVLLGVDGVRR